MFPCHQVKEHRGCCWQSCKQLSVGPVTGHSSSLADVQSVDSDLMEGEPGCKLAERWDFFFDLVGGIYAQVVQVCFVLEDHWPNSTGKGVVCTWSAQATAQLNLRVSDLRKDGERAHLRAQHVPPVSLCLAVRHVHMQSHASRGAQMNRECQSSSWRVPL